MDGVDSLDRYKTIQIKRSVYFRFSVLFLTNIALRFSKKVKIKKIFTEIFVSVHFTGTLL